MQQKRKFSQKLIQYWETTLFKEISHLTWCLPVSETTVDIMSRSGKRLRTGEDEGEGEEEDGDFDPMAFYRWILLLLVQQCSC